MTLAAKRKSKTKAKRSERPKDSAPAWRLQVLKLSQLRTDGETQSRSEMSESTIADYAERLSTVKDERWPPLEAFHDGRDYWLVDGFHRLEALKRNGVIVFDVRVQRGSLRDAQLYSCSVNARHGLRRTTADKRRAIDRLLRDKEWSRRSDRWIAERCAVSPSTVGAVRAQVSNLDTSNTREGQDGKSYPASQPSRPATTVDYDGEGHPPDEGSDRSGSETESSSEAPSGPNPDPSHVDERGVAQDLLDVDPSAALRHACPTCSAPAGTACEGGGGGKTYPHQTRRALVAEAERKLAASSPSPKAEEPPKPMKRAWREVLGLPTTGSIGPLEIVAAFDHAMESLDRSDPRRAEVQRAKAVGLSQWHTKPDLANKMAGLSNVRALARMHFDHYARPLRIIEPSAGIGALCDAIRRAAESPRHIEVTAHEVDPHRCSLLRRHSAVDHVIEGDFLASDRAAERFDLAIANTPSERGLDGLFLEELMERADRIVVLLRINALCGQDRLERVWSRVQRREWALLDLRYLAGRQDFMVGAETETGEEESEEGALSDYCVVYLGRSPESDAEGEPTMVDWW